MALCNSIFDVESPSDRMNASRNRRMFKERLLIESSNANSPRSSLQSTVNDFSFSAFHPKRMFLCTRLQGFRMKTASRTNGENDSS